MTNGKSKLSDAVLDEMEYGELTEHITEAIKVLRRKAYGEGYMQGKFDEAMENTEGFRALDVDVEDVFEKSEQERLDQRMDDLMEAGERWRDNVNPPTIDELRELGKMAVKTAQERRDEIVERAKKDVEELTGDSGVFRATLGGYEKQAAQARFAINKEKRTTVALLLGYYSKKVYERGIAKCAPTDCFNVHIGKAIALRRALGLEVPDEYLNAPQPTEARYGDIISVKGDPRKIKVYGEYERDIYDRRKHFGSSKIIDDSREEVSI